MNDKPDRRSRRRRAWLVVGLLLSAAAGVLLYYRVEIYRLVYLARVMTTPTATPKPASKPASAPTVTESVNTHAYFYRLKARYSYGKEPVEFDVVVGCSVRVTRYKGGDYAFGAARYPRFFVHKTSDGHAVMQILPIACSGQTTENERVPKDFLPGVIWFDRFGDYRFGIAYVSEDAFENPNGKLKFHGASIHNATQAEWDAFRERAAGNEGLRKRYYDGPYYSTEDGRRIAAGGGKEIEAAYARGCIGVLRYKLSESGRALVRKYWPADKPRYWTPADEHLQTIMRGTGGLARTSAAFANGMGPPKQYYGVYRFSGFPTRARGGMIDSRILKLAPAEFFPLRDDRAAPWVFTERVARSKYLDWDVEIHSGPGKGFLYCFTNVTPSGGLESVLPMYKSRPSRMRVDGEPVVAPEVRYWRWPSVFFEGDEYLFEATHIGLS